MRRGEFEGRSSPTSPDGTGAVSPVLEGSVDPIMSEASPQLSPETTVENAREMEIELREGALRAHEILVRAIDTAMVARQSAEAQSGALDKARSEASAAEQKATRCIAAAETALEDDAGAAAAELEAEEALKAAVTERERAEHILSNGAQAAENAAQVTAKARAEEKDALLKVHVLEKNAGSLADKLTESSQEVKNAKREAEEVGRRAEQAEEFERLARNAITEAEKVLEVRRAASAEASKKAYMLREEAEEKSQAMETAARAAEEAEGGERDWEQKTQERLKARELDFKKAQSTANKASRLEQQAEVAENEADMKLATAQEEFEAKEAVAKAEMEASKEANAHVLLKVQEFEEAQNAADTAQVQVKEAQEYAGECAVRAAEAAMAEEETTVERAEDAALRARDAEAKAIQVKTMMAAEALAKRNALKAADAEAASSKTAAESKLEAVKKASEKEQFAETKETHADALVDEFQTQVIDLALARLAARGVHMTKDEAQGAAQSAMTSRLASATDARSQRHSKERHSEAMALSVVDKWILWRRRTETQQADPVPNIRKLFSSSDGNAATSSLDLLISDIVGSALDLGPIDPTMCKMVGGGLSHASLGKMTTFTIIACNAKGLQFEDGGAAFHAGVRFAGLGTRGRAKVADNNDGTYTVGFKPTSTGKCTISVTYLGESLLGSPFICMVSASTPSAPHCEAHGEALNSVAAHRAEHFFLSFRDAMGQLAHACELDVWVEPIHSDQIGVRLPGELDQLQRPLSAFESLIVGPNGLDVQRTSDLNSEWIARLQPGRALRLLKVEDPAENGLLRACVALEQEDRDSRDNATWRELWPSQQDWRTLSWREHIEQVREQEEARALAYAMRQEMAQHQAATRLQAQLRRKMAHKYIAEYTIMRHEEALAAAAEAAARAAKSEGKGKKGKGGASGGGSSQAGKSSSRQGAKDTAKAAAPAPSPMKQTPSKPANTATAAADKPAVGKAVPPPDAKPLLPASTGTSEEVPISASRSSSARVKAEAKAGGKTDAKLAAGTTSANSSAKPAIDVSKNGDGKEQSTASAVNAGSNRGSQRSLTPQSQRKPSTPKSQPRSSTPQSQPKSARSSTPQSQRPAASSNGSAVEANAKAGGMTIPLQEGAAKKIQARVRGNLERRKVGLVGKGDLATGMNPALSEATPLEAAPAPASAAKAKGKGKKGKKAPVKTAEDIEREEAEAKAAAEAELLAIAQAEEAERQAKLEAVRQAEVAAVRKAIARGEVRHAERQATAELETNREQQAVNTFSPRSSARSLRSARGSPRLKLGKLGKQADFGWVTLAENGESQVSKQRSKLPAHIRQQHLQHWTRRSAIDSHRERTRAMERDRSNEEETRTAPRSPGRSIPHSRSPTPSVAYRSERESDPKGAGFAYGGIYPGRLHAKGRLVEQHEVHFSIAKVGSYLMYVSLHGLSSIGERGEETHIPGSPFMLTVSPGPAHPLSTRIPPHLLPLKGTVEQQARGGATDGKGAPAKVSETFAYSMKIETCDKMGNLCRTGGAAVTCGFLDHPTGGQDDEAAAEESSGGFELDAAARAALAAAASMAGKPRERRSAAGPAMVPMAKSHDATCADGSDGTYVCKWAIDRPGSYTVYVKIDGLHVLGSPTTLVMTAPRPTAVAATPAAAPVKESAQRSRMNRPRGSVVEMPSAAPTADAPNDAAENAPGTTPPKKRRESVEAGDGSGSDATASQHARPSNDQRSSHEQRTSHEQLDKEPHRSSLRAPRED